MALMSTARLWLTKASLRRCVHPCIFHHRPIYISRNVVCRIKRSTRALRAAMTVHFRKPSPPSPPPHSPPSQHPPSLLPLEDRSDHLSTRRPRRVWGATRRTHPSRILPSPTSGVVLSFSQSKHGRQPDVNIRRRSLLRGLRPSPWMIWSPTNRRDPSRRRNQRPLRSVLAAQTRKSPPCRRLLAGCPCAVSTAETASMS